MKQYKCHKVVKAAKIQSMVVEEAEKGLLLNFLDGEYISVMSEWLLRHKPEVGGYLVQYEDGYQSYSPAEAFESGYTPIEPEEKMEMIELDTLLLELAIEDVTDMKLLDDHPCVVAIRTIQEYTEEISRLKKCIDAWADTGGSQGERDRWIG